MCDPTGGILTMAVLTAALGVGQAVTTYQGEKAASEAQSAAANQTYALRENSIRAQASQLDTSQSEDAFDREIETIRKQGRITNSISEMGLGSMTGSQLLNVNAFETGRAQTLTDINFAQQRGQLSQDIQGAQLERNTSQGVEPSSLSLILGIGEGVMGGVNSYSRSGGRLPGGKTKAVA